MGDQERYILGAGVAHILDASGLDSTTGNNTFEPFTFTIS